MSDSEPGQSMAPDEPTSGANGAGPTDGSGVGWSVPELLLPLWQERLPGLVARLEAVELALKASGGVSEEEGLTQAHKLHGVLGTFGHMAGSVVAGRAEEILGGSDADTEVRTVVVDQCRELRNELAAMLPPESTT